MKSPVVNMAKWFHHLLVVSGLLLNVNMDNCHSTVTAKDMGDVAICIFTQIVKQASI